MKTKTQHTPGPWTLGDESELRGELLPIGSNTDAPVIGKYVWGPVAEVYFPLEESTVAQQAREMALANARLIAAAPDLLRGCQAAIAYLADPPSKFEVNRDEAVRIILCAIAKAEGK
jgi:hypothetical protein